MANEESNFSSSVFIGSIFVVVCFIGENKTRWSHRRASCRIDAVVFVLVDRDADVDVFVFVFVDDGIWDES